MRLPVSMEEVFAGNGCHSRDFAADGNGESRNGKSRERGYHGNATGNRENGGITATQRGFAGMEEVCFRRRRLRDDLHVVFVTKKRLLRNCTFAIASTYNRDIIETEKV